MIEQLHYTWAEEGRQGLGRYQVTAASPGLADLTSDVAMLALRLCRWSGEESGDVASYGWIDARGYRFVFRRVGVGLTRDGRPGNFAAHVLVGSVSEITTRHLLHDQCEPGLWWGGELDKDQELPLLRPQPLCPWVWAAAGIHADRANRADRPDPDDETVLGTVARLLATGGAGQVSGSWRAVLAAAGCFSRVIPASFSTVSSFSTFERGEPADWFQLVGIGDSKPVAQPPPVAKAAAALIASSDPGDARLARSAAEATEQDGKLPWREFVALAAAFQALVAEGNVDWADLIPSLAKSGTATEVLQLRRGRGVVVDALLADQAGVRDALAVSAEGINGHLVRQLGIDIAERMGLASLPARRTTSGIGADQLGPGPATWQTLLRIAAPLGRAALDGIAEVVLRAADPDCSGWPPQIVQACLRSPALKPGLVPSLAKAAADQHVITHVLTDAAIPVKYRADTAVAALKAGTLSPAGLIDQGSVVPGLVNQAVIRLIPGGMSGAVLTALAPADAVRVVTTIAPDVSESALLVACAPLWQHLGLQDQLRLVAGVNSRLSGSRGTEWDRTADRILQKAVHAQLNDTQQRLMPAPLLEICSRSQKGQAWRRLLRETAFLAGGDITAVAGALRSSYVNSDPNARAYAIQQILPLVHPADVAPALQQLAGTVTVGDLSAAIDAAERHAATTDDISLACRVVELVALDDRDDQYVLQACRQLAYRWLDKQSWVFLEDRLAKAPKEAQRRLDAMRRGRVLTVVPHSFRRWIVDG